jgi:tRNA-2-methylthio-N6-dimethylallyladenosine synthase
VHLEVFGCQMNKLDAELLLAALEERGYRPTDDARQAGVILFNTCAVREHAENRVFSKIGALRKLKEKHPGTIVGVLGCSAQNHGGAIFQRYPHVNIVCGPGEFLRVPDLLELARDGGQVTALDLTEAPKFRRRRNHGPRPWQAYVSVMRGCDQACTFCVVPRTRGREISRPIADIFDECRSLADQGVREITLLGQTVNSYGKRLAKRRAIGLHHVLHELQRIEGLERIRFITSHPRYMTPELIDAMATLPKVCEYLHLPVQSGSDAVLKRMLRGYTGDQYRGIVDTCREKIPGFALATDIIVGFCGETDAEFLETARLVEELPLQGAFAFKYSERAGTRAAELYADDVPDAVKRERHRTILKILESKTLDNHKRSVGAETEVLVEGPSKLDPDRWTGRNRAFQIVVFPREPREELQGRLVTVRITEVTPLVLVGKRCGPAR